MPRRWLASRPSRRSWRRRPTRCSPQPGRRRRDRRAFSLQGPPDLGGPSQDGGWGAEPFPPSTCSSSASLCIRPQ
eukprot:4223740-Pyramimonas_sp.AAC.1